jgi:tryptophan 2,3-dioxygenase
MDPEIESKIKALAEKFSASGQDLSSYLDGLLHSDYLTYWDYVHLDTLLSLQTPRTKFPDELIFIMYHQITELYFKLILHEQRQIADKANIEVDFFSARLKRINKYFEALTKSFDIMIDGMEREQFLQFRMSLLPASGFQSAQYRMIEICSTDFFNLVDKNERQHFKPKSSDAEIEKMFSYIYWNKGATELSSGNKTLTLRQFEDKYIPHLLYMAKEFKSKNIWAKFESLPQADKNDSSLLENMKWLDVNVNINWPLVHYKSAVRYLQQNPSDIAATGGTNWQKYLPPRFQKRIFFPELWTELEIDEWGKAWVSSVLNEK